MSCHAEFLRVALDGDDRLSHAVIEAPHTLAALCTPKQAAIVTLAQIVTRTPWELSRIHRADAHEVGLDDDAILHVILQTAYFGHLNRVADAVAVPLDYVVQIPGTHADPTTPPLTSAPRALAGRPAIEIAKRQLTATALAEWRRYIVYKDEPL